MSRLFTARPGTRGIAVPERRRRLPVATAALAIAVSSFLALPATASQAHSSQAKVPFSGTFTAHSTARVVFPSVFVTAEGSGRAAHLGASEIAKAVHVRITFTPCTAPDGLAGTVAPFTEESTLTAASGDLLYVRSTGSSCHTAAGDIIDATFVVVGGSGRFAGASGGGTEHVEVNDLTHTETTHFAGSLRY